jgi:hypothetical protein
MPIRTTIPNPQPPYVEERTPLKGKSIITYGIPCVVIHESFAMVYLTVLGSTHIFNIDRQFLENFGYERVS